MAKVRLQCPGCKTALVKESVQPNKVYTCPKCGHAIAPAPLRQPAAPPVARPTPAIPVAIPTPVPPPRARPRSSCGKALLVGVLMLLVGGAVGGGGMYGLLIARQKARGPQPIARGDEATTPKPAPPEGTAPPPAKPPESGATPVGAPKPAPPAEPSPPAPEPSGPPTEVVAAPALPALDLGKPVELKGHKGGVAYVEFSPDGSHLVSVGGEVLLWDLATGQSTALVTENAVPLARFSADGKTVIAGSRERAGTWDVGTTLGKTAFPGELVAAADGGRTLVTRTQDNARYHYHVWDVTAAREALVFDDRLGSDALAVSPDGKTVAFGAYRGGEIRLFDLPAGKEREPIQGLAAELRDLAFSPDSSVLVCPEQNELSLWDVADAAAKPRLKYRLESGTRLGDNPLPNRGPHLGVHGVGAPRFAPDGKTLTLGADGALAVWNVAAHRGRNTLPAQAPVAYAADGKTFAALSWDRARIVIADAATGKVRTAVDVVEKHRGSGSAAWYGAKALSPDGGVLAYGTADGLVELRPLAAGGAGGLKELATLAFPEPLDVPREHTYAFAPEKQYEGALFFSRDGRFLVGAGANSSYSGALAVWNVADRKPVGTMRTEGAWTFLADNRTLFTQETDRNEPNEANRAQEVAYDLQTGQRRAAPVPVHIPYQRFRFSAMALAPDGKNLAADLVPGLADKEAQTVLLDPAKVQPTAMLAKGPAEGERFAFSADSKLLAVPRQGKVRLWDLETQKERPTTARAGAGLAFADNGRALVTVGDDRLSVYDTDTGQLSHAVDLRQGHAGQVYGVAISPVAALFASVGDNGQVLLHDLATGQVRARGLHSGQVVAAGFSLDGKLLATASLDKTLKLWEVGDLPPAGADVAGPAKPRPPAGPAGPPRAATGPPQPRAYAEFPCEEPGQWGYLRFSQDGNRVAVGNGKVQLWDLAAKAQLLPAAGKPDVSWGSGDLPCLSPDGRTVLHGGYLDSHLSAFDLGSDTLHPLPLSGACGATAFSPDGKFVAVGMWTEKLKEGKVLAVYDLTTRTEKAALTAFDASVSAVGYTPDGSELFAILSDRDGTRLLRLDPDTLKQRADFGKAKTDDFSSLVFSPDSKLVGAHAEDGGLVLREVATGKARPSINSVRESCCFVADRPLLATGNYARMTIWDVNTGQPRLRTDNLEEIRVAAGRTKYDLISPSYDTAFSADGRWQAVGVDNGMVYFFDLLRGKLASQFKAHQGGVQGLAFSPDGRFLVTVGAEKKLKVWSLDGAAPPGR